jgi:hypothetical protein
MPCPSSICVYKDKLDVWGSRKYKRRRDGDAAASLDLSEEIADVDITEAASALVHHPYLNLMSLR